MPKTEQQRQKKLAKKRSKEIAKRKELARQQSVMESLPGQIIAASSGAVKHCLVSDNLFNDASKMGMVLIARQIPDGRVVCVWFLVDAFCLGVKDHHFLVGYPRQISEYVDHVTERQALRRVSAPFAKKLVESSIAFADQFGLSPAAGYQKLAGIWGNIDSSECNEEFHFGDEDGKPQYISGPFDSPEFQAQVLQRLKQNAGEGNYHFILMAGPDSDRFQDGELLGDD